MAVLELFVAVAVGEGQKSFIENVSVDAARCVKMGKPENEGMMEVKQIIAASQQSDSDHFAHSLPSPTRHQLFAPPPSVHRDPSE